MKPQLRYIIALAILISLLLLFRGCKDTFEEKPFILQNDSLTVAIALDAGMYYKEGRPIGFMYNLIELYGEAHKTKINIEIPYSDYDPWELLMNNEIDFLVFNNILDSIPPKYSEKVLYSIPIADSFVWVVTKENHSLLNYINYWLGYYMQKREYSQLVRQFFRSYRIDKHLYEMTQTNMISPYDAIIKLNSRLLGWDWRLLSAIVFKESRFSMGAHSSKGAVGLMQIKEATALHYGITNIYNPANNIRAGVLHLRHLKNIFVDYGMDSTNIVKFTLAAYNAGEGRIDDCINFANSLGKDCRDWEIVSRIIPLMRDPNNYKSGILKFGKFRGDETIEYVDDVLSKYEEYLFVIKP